jgi:hypothetical protein
MLEAALGQIFLCNTLILLRVLERYMNAALT